MGRKEMVNSHSRPQSPPFLLVTWSAKRKALGPVPGRRNKLYLEYNSYSRDKSAILTEQNLFRKYRYSWNKAHLSLE